MSNHNSGMMQILQDLLYKNGALTERASGMGTIEQRVTINGIDVTARYSDRAVNGIFVPLLRKWTAKQQAKGGKILAMLAAPPEAGKSTLFSFLKRLAEETKGPSACFC